VLIGRETTEYKVDIDLGREGHANRVSRRQVHFISFYHIVSRSCHSRLIKLFSKMILLDTD